ncbi:HlyD family secretion protein [Rhodopirellula sp. P2]|uniref:HlyD family secretion protein n=1 Tax=Rhodopirellula sp. P2 TaxID=2127060 RepID=UPI002367EE80|nr:efflux RND transporter periplasmic adaptor subunit [Rhodopirellula sp. P2]WDQ14890.1 efflux RND transporter periplasmic adaptor subunit [Rhodopirellula sp. P2]
MFKRLLLSFLIVAVGVGGWVWWRTERATQIANALPPEIVLGNGRIEAVQVDVAAKYAGRVSEITVHEGDMVKPGQTLVKLDTAELRATMAKAKAQRAEAVESLAEAEAEIVRYESELLLADRNLQRTAKLVDQNAASQEEYDTRKSQLDSAKAILKVAQAHRRTSQRAIEAVDAEIERIQTQIDDFTLTSTVEGRVLYRLAEEGEVVSAGGKVLTLLDLSDIYMEIFLPSEYTSQLSIHADARIALDFAPQYTIPATVSFVSPEAQFTPKQVETMKERDKLMFRVKVQIPRELVKKHIEKVKTGVRGVAYVKLDPNVPWPERLSQRFPQAIEFDKKSFEEAMSDKATEPSS